MKLNKLLYVNGELVALSTNMVSLKLSQGGIGIFTIKSDAIPEIHDPVRFDIGYDNKLRHWFEGYVEKVQPAQNGHYKITVKEMAGILIHRWPLSLEHPTLREALDKLSELTGLNFQLPENAAYTDIKIPNFACQGTGYQCLKQLGRAFNIPDFVWFQQADQSIYVGSYELCRFHNKHIDVPLDLSSRQNGDNITFAPFPILRPGAVIKSLNKRITRLDLIKDEMTAYWQESPAAKQREILQHFPELAAGHHLPRLATVHAVRDNAQAGNIADPFRPRFSVDVQLLDENLQPDLKVPVYKSIPLPVNFGGGEAGLLAYPLEGTLVEIAFAYGRNDLPIIRGVYGRDHALPTIAPGEQLQQQRDEVSKRIDAAGNCIEQTDQQHSKQSFQQNDKADNYTGDFGQHHLSVEEHSTEEIGGKKLIEALGAISLLSGDDLTLGTLSNMQQAIAGELITTIGKLRNIIVAQDDKLKVMGNKIQTIEKDFRITAKNIKQDADTIKFNGGKGVCTGATICPFTGSPHVDVSTTVFAGK